MEAGPGGQPPRRFADLRLRLASAAVAAAAGLALVWAGGLWTVLLAGLAGGAMIWEYRSVTAHGGGRCGQDVAFLLAGVAGAAVVAGLYSPLAAFVWLGWSVIVAAAADLVSGRRGAMGWGALGAIYIGTAVIGFVYLRGLEPHGLVTVIWLVLVVAATDIGGYFGGRLVGGPKLWPRISPKKTWAGLAGGLALAVLAGVAAGRVAGETPGSVLAAAAAAAALVAQAGDLAESALKRHFGVKDSGRLLPGHGGALDRFDGLAPAAAALALASWLGGGSAVIW